MREYRRRLSTPTCQRMQYEISDSGVTGVTNAECSSKVAHSLNFSGRERTLHHWRQGSCKSQFWVYSRALMREMVEYVQATKGKPFHKWLPWMRIADLGLYDTWAVHSAANAYANGRAPVQPLRNLPAVLKRAVPKVFAKCCACAGFCKDVGVLLGKDSCFLKNLGPEAMGRLVAETVGMFGIYTAQGIPPNNPLYSMVPGPFWCVNNCFQSRNWKRAQHISSVSARVRYAFQYTPEQGKRAGERGYGKGRSLDCRMYGASKIELPEDRHWRPSSSSHSLDVVGSGCPGGGASRGGGSVGRRGDGGSGGRGPR